MHIIGIYKITNPKGKVYIGQSWAIQKRFNKYFYSNNIGQPKLNSSLIKYGVKNHKFEIICQLPEDITQEVLDRYEQLYMDLYRNCNVKLLNIREAGSRGKVAEETKLKLSKAHTGKVLSDITKQRISENRKGKCLGILNHMYGKLVPNHNKSRKHTKEEIEKRASKLRIPIIQCDIEGNEIKEWSCAEEVKRVLKISAASIRVCCRGNGPLKTTGGFKWKNK